MTKNYSLAIIAITILLGAWFVFGNSLRGEESEDVFWKGYAPGEKDTGHNGEKTFPVILYTENGFSPKSLNVPAGETVVFSNTIDRGLWVAGPPHPTHHLYPEFNQGGVSGKGEAYKFTFEKSGQWAYHNHVKPQDFGIIKVK